MDDDATLRRRRADARDGMDRRAPGWGGSACMLFVVVDKGHLPTGPLKYYACYPVTVWGAETEGGAPTFVAGSSEVDVAVLNGSPVPGDYLIGRRAGNRWVAEEGLANPYSGPPIPHIPNCSCSILPTPITLSIDATCRAANLGSMFGTLAAGTFDWQTTPAAMVGATGIIGPAGATDYGFWDTTVRTDPTLGGAQYMQFLGCSTTNILIQTVYLNGGGVPAGNYGANQVWPIGVGGNVCSPFLMPYSSCPGCPPCTCCTLSG